MAKDESDREDLLAEARVLINRAEYHVPHWSDSLVIGWRTNHALSLFLGQDPAYHWNSANELRRAYVAGKLYKAEQRKLVALTRVRTASVVELQRAELTAAETTAFLVTLAADLQRVEHALGDPATHCIGHVLTTISSAEEFLTQALQRLQDLQQGQLRIANQPGLC